MKDSERPQEPRRDYSAAEMEAVSREKDALRDHVDRIWSAWLREEEDESMVDFWVRGGTVRVSYEWGSCPSAYDRREWKDYPASIFESEEKAEARAKEWLLGEEARKKAEAEKRKAESDAAAERRERAELERLQAKYGQALAHKECARRKKDA